MPSLHLTVLEGDEGDSGKEASGSLISSSPLLALCPLSCLAFFYLPVPFLPREESGWLAGSRESYPPRGGTLAALIHGQNTTFPHQTGVFCVFFSLSLSTTWGFVWPCLSSPFPTTTPLPYLQMATSFCSLPDHPQTPRHLPLHTAGRSLGFAHTGESIWMIGGGRVGAGVSSQSSGSFSGAAPPFPAL